jgi:ribosomal protein S27AE
MEAVRQKKCRACGLSKPMTAFYRHRAMRDGHLNRCVECVKERVRKYRAANIERVREYDRNRPNRDERCEVSTKQNRERYYKDPEFRSRVLKTKRDWIAQNKLKRRAHVITGNAIKSGSLEKRPCEVCGAKDVDAHHEDYRVPLDVRWLCHKHHMERHREINEEIRIGVDWSYKGF